MLYNRGMNEQLLQPYRFTLAYTESLMEGVSEEEMLLQPSDGVNPPAWLIGHLAVVNDMALGMLGAQGVCPAGWGELFGPGSSASVDPQACPSREELMTALRDSHAAVCAAVETADLSQLTDPNPIGPLVKSFPTLGDLVGHILTTHPASHLGHLSNWRRQTGRPPIF